MTFKDKSQELKVKWPQAKNKTLKLIMFFSLQILVFLSFKLKNTEDVLGKAPETMFSLGFFFRKSLNEYNVEIWKGESRKPQLKSRKFWFTCCKRQRSKAEGRTTKNQKNLRKLPAKAEDFSSTFDPRRLSNAHSISLQNFRTSIKLRWKVTILKLTGWFQLL